MDGSTGAFLFFFAGLVVVSAKLYFGRRDKEVAAAKKAQAVKRFCSHCGQEVKRKNGNE